MVNQCTGRSQHQSCQSWSRAGVKNDRACHQLSGTESPIPGWKAPLSFIYCSPAWTGQAPAHTSFLLLMLLLVIVKVFSELHKGFRCVKTLVPLHQHVASFNMKCIFCVRVCVCVLLLFLNCFVFRTSQNLSSPRCRNMTLIYSTCSGYMPSLFDISCEYEFSQTGLKRLYFGSVNTLNSLMEEKLFCQPSEHY